MPSSALKMKTDYLESADSDEGENDHVRKRTIAPRRNPFGMLTDDDFDENEYNSEKRKAIVDFVPHSMTKENIVNRSKTMSRNKNRTNNSIPVQIDENSDNDSALQDKENKVKYDSESDEDFQNELGVKVGGGLDGGNEGRRRFKPPRPSMNAVRKSIANINSSATGSKRRRRRSSARFLRLQGSSSGNNHTKNNFNKSNGNQYGGINQVGSEDSNDDNASIVTNMTSTLSVDQNLSELYDKAIRMNAENKINAGNSWNLRLIENIDKFLEHVLEEDGDNDDDDIESLSDTSLAPGDNSIEKVGGLDSNPKEVQPKSSKKRVNFTKASCTLDASVKIYSYRVDDVHLTSYKVLANLNRSDTNKGNKNNGVDGDDFNSSNNDDNNNGDVDDSQGMIGSEGGRGSKNSQRNSAKQNGNTLESNIDAAFDIDPLFHKMSKSFDEGGAKGLLLHNLGVGSHGCNIVFDSSCDDVFQEPGTLVKVGTTSIEDENRIEALRVPEGMMDIACLTAKLEQMIDNQTVECLQLVPQLESLRHEYSELEASGFTDDGTITPSTRRNRRKFCVPDPDEEREAEQSIRESALTRVCRYSMTPSKKRAMARFGHDADNTIIVSPHNDEFDDAGGHVVQFSGEDNYDDDDDDYQYYDVGLADDAESRASRFSIQEPVQTKYDQNSNLATTNILDALSDGKILLSSLSTSSEYFSQKLLRDSSNVWAGAAHWKRSCIASNSKTISGTNKSEKQKTAGRARKKVLISDQNTVVSLGTTTKDFSFLFSSKTMTKSSATREKKKKCSNKPTSIQLSKALVTKYTNNENILPEDSGYQIKQLTQLFLRPDIEMKPNEVSCKMGRVEENSHNGGFDAPPLEGLAWGNNESFGDDDNDDPGFAMASDNDFADNTFMTQNDTSQFVHSELADVRKVEKITVGYATIAKKVDVKRLKSDLWTDLQKKLAMTENNIDQDTVTSCNETMHTEQDSCETTVNDSKVLSFQQAVHDLDVQQSQADVTLPFYFICILHLANEKCLKLGQTTSDDSDNIDLRDFTIEQDFPFGGVGTPYEMF